jgi:hypothetical protein|tara:strand:+ start:6939 stop:8075 length:1137 start_codon:yes stop_codon:yes gene_type:complete
MIKIIIAFYHKFINFFIIFNNINLINSKKLKFIFYSENKSYQKYSYQLIKLLARKYPDEVCYVSSDINDKIISFKIKNLFIGNNLLMKYFFTNIKAENLILTLTDLDNHIIKKTKNIKRYIYFFHAPVSTTKSYTAGAFDNYDMILCNGNYQIDEIRKREFFQKNKKKELIKSGYFYFDYLKENLNHQKIPNEILIAPSWNFNQENFMNKNIEIIIDEALNKGFKVRYRPHPENFKRSKNILDAYKKKFINNDFILDDSAENITSMENAKCLITDNSGIAIEYILLLKRPVLYFEDFQKIHNTEYKKFDDLIAIEDKIKDLFGYSFKKNEISNLESIINNSISDFHNKDEEIQKFINDNFYSFGTTIKNFENLLSKFS